MLSSCTLGRAPMPEQEPRSSAMRPERLILCSPPNVVGCEGVTCGTWGPLGCPSRVVDACDARCRANQLKLTRRPPCAARLLSYANRNRCDSKSRVV
jgi:hypothetical protein